MVYSGMAYDPVLFTYNGCAFCPDCEPEGVPQEEVVGRSLTRIAFDRLKGTEEAKAGSVVYYQEVL